MDDCIRVLELHFKEGLSDRAVARQTGLHRNTVRKILSANGGVKVYQVAERKCTSLGGVR